MIYLKSITLRHFKGIENLTCEFDDLTILAGLNNSGKTSVLEAVHIVLSSLVSIAANPNLFHKESRFRGIDLAESLATLGMPKPEWVVRYSDWSTALHIGATFANGLNITIERSGVGNFCFDLSSNNAAVIGDELQPLVAATSKFTSEFISAPGIVSPREAMISGPEYKSRVRQGTGGQLWRNQLFWSIQSQGIEQFEPVRDLIREHFPHIDVAVPVLDSENNPPTIQFKYREEGQEPLDIAQSGAGLRTFVTLARLLEQSNAQITLFDEPDAHLHASQQAIVLNLLLEAACGADRQVIVATHSPEILVRAPSECIRWIDRDRRPETVAGSSMELLARLGAAPDTYLPRGTFPDVIVYVEGKTDRGLIEALIEWCVRKAGRPLPTTLVVSHRNGKFDKIALQALGRLVGEVNADTRVVGLRDLDWEYSETPAETPQIEKGERWLLLDLPCKELENLFCNTDVLHEGYEKKLSRELLSKILDDESKAVELIHDWKINVQPRIRERLERGLADPTKEDVAMKRFDEWAANSTLRCRLVSGKSLFGRVREKIRREHKMSCYPKKILDRLSTLPSSLAAVAEAIFPDHKFS